MLFAGCVTSGHEKYLLKRNWNYTEPMLRKGLLLSLKEQDKNQFRGSQTCENKHMIINKSVQTSEMPKGCFEYSTNVLKDRHKSQSEINEKMQFLIKKLSATTEFLLHSQQEIEKHIRRCEELNSALYLSQKKINRVLELSVKSIR